MRDLAHRHPCEAPLVAPAMAGLWGLGDEELRAEDDTTSLRLFAALSPRRETSCPKRGETVGLTNKGRLVFLVRPLCRPRARAKTASTGEFSLHLKLGDPTWHCSPRSGQCPNDLRMNCALGKPVLQVAGASNQVAVCRTWFMGPQSQPRVINYRHESDSRAG